LLSCRRERESKEEEEEEEEKARMRKEKVEEEEEEEEEGELCIWLFCRNNSCSLNNYAIRIFHKKEKKKKKKKTTATLDSSGVCRSMPISCVVECPSRSMSLITWAGNNIFPIWVLEFQSRGGISSSVWSYEYNLISGCDHFTKQKNEIIKK
jgi:hypothetical protein